MEDGLGQLPGAKTEAKRVTRIFKTEGLDVSSSINEEYNSVISHLFGTPHKYIHLAGHGVFNPENPAENGMVIGESQYLSVREIRSLHYVPEFVFVNCCYLGQVDSTEEKYTQYRSQLAANIGVALIEKGVKAVIVAGWAVDDQAALEFAETFYREMFSGSKFGDAVKQARHENYMRFGSSNTWGAYQCYGDPSFRMAEKSNGGSGPSTPEFLFDEEYEVYLENILARVDNFYKDPEELLTIDGIEESVWQRSNPKARLFELIGRAYFQHRQDEKAFKNFSRMLEYEHAEYDLKSFEEYHLVKRKLIQDGSELFSSPTTELNNIIKAFEALQVVHPTAERHHLIGGTFKVKALIQMRESRNKSTIEKTIKSAIESYFAGLKIERANGGNILFPLTNMITLDRAAASLTGSRRQVRKEWENLLNQEDHTVTDDKCKFDFWNEMRASNINLCRLVINANQQNLETLKESVRQVKSKGGSPKKWASETEHIELLIKLFEPNKQLNNLLEQYLEFLTNEIADKKTNSAREC